MTPDDFVAFASRLTTLGELYDASFSEAKLILYFEALKDLPLESVADGLVACAKSCTFMPKPAEIRAQVVGDSDDVAEIAWLKYKQLAREIGGYSSPTFEDAALAGTILAVFGSWESACWSDFTPEMWAAKRKEFGRVYRVMQQRGLTETKQLAGFFERENSGKGLPESQELTRWGR